MEENPHSGSARRDGIVQKVRDAESESLPKRLIEPLRDKNRWSRSEPGELLIEILVHFLPGFYQPAGSLVARCTFCGTPRECTPDDWFAFTVMIGIRGIDIIHTVVDRVPDHPGCFILVNLPAFFQGSRMHRTRG